MIKSIINYFKLLRTLKGVNPMWFKILDEIMKFAVSVQQSGKPMLTKIAVVDLSKDKIIGDFDIVDIWAGVGEANPIKRITELKNQISELKRLLNVCAEKIDKEENKDLLTNIFLVNKCFE